MSTNYTKAKPARKAQARRWRQDGGLTGAECLDQAMAWFERHRGVDPTILTGAIDEIARLRAVAKEAGKL